MSKYHSLAFIHKGAYKFHHGGVETLIDPLTALFFATDDEYAVSHPSCCGDDCLEFCFEEELLREARPSLRRAETLPGHIPSSKSIPFSSRTRRTLCVMAKRMELGVATDLEIEESALALLGTVGAIESEMDSTGAGRPTANGRARKKVERAREIVLSDLGRNWSLDEVAALVGASPFHLTRMVHRFCGATLHRFLTQQRLAAALPRVLDGADDLTEIALDLGFSSHSHFSAAFRREYGATPSSLRGSPER